MLNALLILGMQLIIVPLSTLRTTFVVKGKKQIAASVAIIESMIYVTALGMIFSDLSNWVNMVAYAIGYAGGVFLGCTLEEKLAIGYRTVNVSLLNRCDSLIEHLREQGFGVTLFEGEGRDGDKRYRLDIITKRTREKELMDILEKDAPRAFVVAYEPTSFKGGYLVKSMKKAQFPLIDEPVKLPTEAIKEQVAVAKEKVVTTKNKVVDEVKKSKEE